MTSVPMVSLLSVHGYVIPVERSDEHHVTRGSPHQPMSIEQVRDRCEVVQLCRIDPIFSLEDATPHEIALAMPNAAAAARPPITTVCRALRTGEAPVNLPFTYPKMASATSVMPTEAGSAILALRAM